MKTKIVFLGTGPSLGTPVINCRCRVCLSDNQRDKRLRSSVLIRTAGKNILIDCSPDFRQQMLAAKISKIDAVIFTHAHRDHTGGIPDLANTFRSEPPDFFIPFHCFDLISELIKNNYALENTNLSINKLQKINSSPFQIGNRKFSPLHGWHGKQDVTGYYSEKWAYLTDMNSINDADISKLLNIDTLIISALQIESHSTHLTVAEAVEWAQRTNARKTWLVHLGHDAGTHIELEAMLPVNIKPAYDGLETFI